MEGGKGMAPMRSHLYELFRTLKTGRKVTFWYMEVVLKGCFHLDHFVLEKDFTNLKFYVALSEPMKKTNWKVKEGLDGDGDGFKRFQSINASITAPITKPKHQKTLGSLFLWPTPANQAWWKNG